MHIQQLCTSPVGYPDGYGSPLMGSLAPELVGDMNYAIIYSSWQSLWRVILNGDLLSPGIGNQTAFVLHTYIL